jgi:hypothetical protein
MPLLRGLDLVICEANFGPILEDLAFEVIDVQATFGLSQIPDPATIVVKVDGVEQPPEAWTYDEESNSVTFNVGYAPDGGAEVVISYEVL